MKIAELKRWGVVAACSFVVFVMWIVLRMSGLWFVAFLEVYDSDRKSAALPTTLHFMLRCLSGPLAAYVAEVIGLREVTIVGCLVSSIGVGTCFFAQNMIHVTISLGLIYGIGNCLAISLLPHILSLHFKENLSNAYGIHLAAIGVFSLAYPSVCKFLLEIYGLQGTFLIIASIMLHTIPVAMLLKNDKKREKKCAAAQVNKMSNSKDLSETCEKSRQDFPVTSHGNDFSDFKVEQNRKSHCALLEEGERSSNFQYDIDCRYAIQSKTTTAEDPCNSSNLIQISEDVYEKRLENIFNETENESPKDDSEGKSLNLITTFKNENQFRTTSISNDNDGEIAIDLRTTQTQLNAIETHVIQSQASELKKTNEIKYKKTKDGNDIHIESLDVPSTSDSRNVFKAGLKTLHVLKEPPYLVIMFNQSMLYYIVGTLWVVLVDISRDKGILRIQEVYILMLLPISEVFGGSCLGWVTDKGYVTKANFTGASFIILGLSCVILAWVGSFPTTMLAVFIFGTFSMGSNISVPGLIYQFVDKDKHTMAMSSRYMLFAPLGYSMSPMIGYFRGTLGSYNGVLYLLTSICLVCGVLFILLPHIAKCYKTKK